tara:strand:- start:890 stop:1516 length:627 start_codon:yes stop_codon:yes gene_type:complete
MSSTLNVASGLCPSCGYEFDGGCTCGLSAEEIHALQGAARDSTAFAVKLTAAQEAAVAAWDAERAALQRKLREVEAGHYVHGGITAACAAVHDSAAPRMAMAERALEMCGLLRTFHSWNAFRSLHPTLRDDVFVREDGQCYMWSRKPDGQSVPGILAPVGKMEGAAPLLPPSVLAALHIDIQTDDWYGTSATARIKWGTPAERAALGL